MSGVIVVGGAQDFTSRGFLRSINVDITTDLFRLSALDSDGNRQEVLRPHLPRVGVSDLASGGGTVFLEQTSAFTVTAIPGLTPSPFDLSGPLRIIDLETQATLFDGAVFGHGTASWSWVTSPFGGADILSGARYEFTDVNPVPEPATMLLLGSGLAGLAARHRRRGTPRARTFCQRPPGGRDI